ncbi:carboxylesterase/lipase family protein [Sphingosinithalassobacter portus]|uniref:carboxylesterase/lipase family protein n=1 Tax=Stakelama portus TaxID=2676234 RepID=UPI000D6E3517|nr:carboxylesterase family protein [Sphingosinithalassobacter portus]
MPRNLHLRAIPRWIALFFAALLASGCAHDRIAQPVGAAAVVSTQTGRISGSVEGELHVFRGIPYAAPPIGDLRWRAPRPAAHWDGVRAATAFGPACKQPPVPTSSFYYSQLPATSEDCLTLNVWAPDDAADAPVIVYIHGGSLQIGSGADPLYSGENFAKRGVVFVSINYRLGVLGWLAHPALSARSPDGVSGNYGLLDQIAALQWVRDNIASFGGDSRNVTVMGESAGALSISYLLTSPRARGLFDKAIVESANTRAVPALRTPMFGLPSAEDIGTKLMSSLGAATLDDMLAMDADTLTVAAARARFTPQGTIDGAVLPGQVVETFDAGEQAKVPMIAGFNSGEVRTQRAFLPEAPASAEAYEAAIRAGYGDLAPAFLAVYPSSDIETSMIGALRDTIYGWATERMVRLQSAAGVPAYLYLFDHCQPEARARDICAFHASELPFVFGHLDAAHMPPNWPGMAGDADAPALSDAMLDYWTSFAATGTPHSEGNAAWAPYGDTEAFMTFAERPLAGHNPIPGMFEVQEEWVRRHRAAGQQWFLESGVRAAPRADGSQ